jgi:hypothetical protein
VALEAAGHDLVDVQAALRSMDRETRLLDDKIYVTSTRLQELREEVQMHLAASRSAEYQQQLSAR